MQDRVPSKDPEQGIGECTMPYCKEADTGFIVNDMVGFCSEAHKIEFYEMMGIDDAQVLATGASSDGKETTPIHTEQPRAKKRRGQ